MYILLLCWRYLRTRYLAFICIVSVMLGVATLIVVNSVMSGFSTKLRDRMHAMLSDVIIECPSYNGFPMRADEMMARIDRSPAGRHIEAMTPTIEVFAIAQYKYPDGLNMTRPVHLIGTDPAGRARIGEFSEFFQSQANREHPSFDLSPQARSRFEQENPLPEELRPPAPADPNAPPPIDPPPHYDRDPKGIFVGYNMAYYHGHKVKPDGTRVNTEIPILQPGDTVQLMTIGAGKENAEPVHSSFVVADIIKTEMAEHDSQFVYVPLDYLQQLRGMEGRVTHIQIKLKDYDQAPGVVEELKKLFPPGFYHVSTWEDKQGAILAAIDVERSILNLLLFLIIGVAGFSILAIFTMIVVEKTRDIGILKSLGASSKGIMSIFLGYGLLLGIIGALLGTATGLMFTDHINEIEKWLGGLTGREIFPRDVYYFDKIPTNVEPVSVALVNVGAIVSCVLFSILPALRAAWLHPVRALRYE